MDGRLGAEIDAVREARPISTLSLATARRLAGSALIELSLASQFRLLSDLLSAIGSACLSVAFAKGRPMGIPWPEPSPFHAVRRAIGCARGASLIGAEFLGSGIADMDTPEVIAKSHQ